MPADSHVFSRSSGRSWDRDSIVSAVRGVALPLLVAVLYLNLSDVIARRTAIPSLLQPLILTLLVAVILYRDRFGARGVISAPVALLSCAYAVVLFTGSATAWDAIAANTRIAELARGIVILMIVGAVAASWAALQRSMMVIAASAALMSLLTVVQAATGRYDLQFGGLARSERGHIYGNLLDIRPGGPVGDPNFFGQILVIAFPIAAILGLGGRGRRRIAFFVAAMLIATAAILTYSRGALIGLAVVFALTILRAKVRLTGAAIVLAAAALIVPQDLTQRLLIIVPFVEDGSPTERRDSSLDRRLLDARIAVGMFSDHPLLGVGAGNFSRHYARYANQVGSAAPQYDAWNPNQAAHSLYLEIAAESGIAGLGAFVLLMGAALRMVWRARGRLIAEGLADRAVLLDALAIAVIGYLVTSLFLHGAFQRYLWLLLGLMVAAARVASVESAAERAGRDV